MMYRKSLYKESVFIYSEDENSSQTQAMNEIKTNALNSLKRQYSLAENQKTQTLFGETVSSGVHFLNLNVVEKRKTESKSNDIKETKETKQKIFKISDLFDSHPYSWVDDSYADDDDSDLKPRLERLFMQGGPGVGKSMWSAYVANYWATNKSWQQKFDWVFKLTLKNLARCTIDKQPYSPQVIIHQECFSDLDFKIFEQLWIKIQNSSRILLILDGLDEISFIMENPQHFLYQAIEQLLSSDYHLIVTSRSSDFKLVHPHQELEILGFTDESLELYVENFFSNLAKNRFPLLEKRFEQKGKSLLALLKSHFYLWEVAHHPISLNILCGIYQQDFRVFQSSTVLTALHSMLKKQFYLLDDLRCSAQTNVLLEMSLQGQKIAMNILRGMDEQGIKGFKSCVTLSMVYSVLETQAFALDNLRYPAQKTLLFGVTKEEQEIFLKQYYAEIVDFLGRLAYEGMKSEVFTFQFDWLATVLEQLHGYSMDKQIELFKQSVRMGFLKLTPNQGIEDLRKPTYEFLEYSFQEYFTARHIANVFSNQYPEVTTFIRENKWDPRYQRVWLFVGGLVGSKLPEYLALLQEPQMQEIMGHYSLALEAQVMEEAYESQSSATMALLEPIRRRIQEELANLHCQYQRYGAVVFSDSWLLNALRNCEQLIACEGMQDLAALLTLNSVEEESLKTSKDISNFLTYLRLGTPRVWDSLGRFLKNPDQNIRKNALKAIEKLGAVRAIPEVLKGLLACLNDIDPEIRHITLEIFSINIEGLNSLNIQALDSMLVRELINFLRANNNENDCKIALGILKNLEVDLLTTGIISVLAECLSRDKKYVYDASVILEKISQTCMGELLKSLGNLLNSAEDPLVRKATLEMVRMLGVDASTPELVEALLTCLMNDSSLEVRTRALEIIHALKMWENIVVTPEIIGILAEFLSHNEGDVYECESKSFNGKHSRADILAIVKNKIQSLNPELPRYLIPLLKGTNLPVSKVTLEILEGSDDEVVTPELLQAVLECLSDADRDIRRAALKTINSLKIKNLPDTLTALKEFLSSHSHEKNVFEGVFTITKKTALLAAKKMPRSVTPELLQLLWEGLSDVQQEVCSPMFKAIKSLNLAEQQPTITPEILRTVIASLSRHLSEKNVREYVFFFVKKIAEAFIEKMNQSTRLELSQSLVVLLKKPDAGIRKVTLEMIRVLGSEVVTLDLFQMLLECLNDADEQVCITILQEIKSLNIAEKYSTMMPEMFRALIECLSHHGWEVREEVFVIVKKMTKSATPDLSELLVEFLKGTNLHMRKATLAIIAALGIEVVTLDLFQMLLECLNDADWQVCNIILQEIESLNVTEKYPRMMPEMFRASIGCLSHHEWHVRAEVFAIVKKMAQSGTSELAELLMAFLKEPDKDFRKATLEVIEVLGVEVATPELLQAVARCLSDEDERVCSATLKAMKSLNIVEKVHNTKEMLQALIEYLSHHEEEVFAVVEKDVREEVFAIVKKMAQSGTSELAELLMVFLKEPDKGFRKATLEVIEALGVEAATPALLQALAQCLRDSDWAVCSATLKAMKSLNVVEKVQNKKEILQALIECLSHHEWGVREDTLRIFKKMAQSGTSELAELLMVFLKEPDKGFRKATLEVIEVLGVEIATPELLQAVARCLSDEDERVCSATLKAMKSLNIVEKVQNTKEILQALIECLSRHEQGVREDTLRIFKKMAQSRTSASELAGLLIVFLKEPDKGFRKATLEMIRALGAEVVTWELCQMLLECLNDAEREVCITILQKIKSLNIAEKYSTMMPEIFRALIECLSHHERDVREEVFAIFRGIAQSGTLELAGLLTVFLKEPDKGFRKATLEVIEVLGVEVATPALLQAIAQCLSDKDDRVCSASLEAMKFLNVVEKVQNTIKCLTEIDRKVRRPTPKKIGATLERLRFLEQCLMEPEKDVYRSALWEIRTLDFTRFTPEMVKVLSQCLSNNDPSIRWAALQTIEGLSHKETETIVPGLFHPLVDCLRDVDRRVREVAPGILNTLPTKRRFENLILILEQSLCHPDTPIRESGFLLVEKVIVGIVNINTPALLNACVNALKDTDVKVRKAVLKTIFLSVQLTHSMFLEVFIECLANADQNIRMLILAEMKGLGVDVTPKLFKFLIDCLRDIDNSTRQSALGIIQSLRVHGVKQELVEVLRACFRDVNWLVRKSAFKAMQALRVKITAPEMLGVLEESLFDLDQEVRLAALTEIRTLEAQVAIMPEMLQGLMVCIRDAEGAIRKAALVTIKVLAARVITSQILQTVIECLSDSSRDIRDLALEAIGVLDAYITVPDMSQVLLIFLGSANQEVRKAVLSVLGAKTLTACIRDANVDVRRDLLENMWKLELSRSHIVDPRYIRRAALWVKRATSIELLQIVVQCLRDGDQNTSRAACVATEDLRMEFSKKILLTTLVEYLKSSDQNRCEVALEILWGLNTSMVTNPCLLKGLVECLKEDDQQIRKAGFDIIRMLDPSTVNSELFEALLGCLDETNEATCQAIFEILQGFNVQTWSHEFLEIVPKFLRHNSVVVRGRAERVMENLSQGLALAYDRWLEQSKSGMTEEALMKLCSLVIVGYMSNQLVIQVLSKTQTQLECRGYFGMRFFVSDLTTEQGICLKYVVPKALEYWRKMGKVLPDKTLVEVYQNALSSMNSFFITPHYHSMIISRKPEREDRDAWGRCPDTLDKQSFKL